MTRRLVLAIAAVTVSGCTRRTAAPEIPTRARAVERGLLRAGSMVSLRTVERIEPAPAAQGFGAVLVADITDTSGQSVAGSGAPVRLAIRPEGLALAAVMIYGDWRAVSAEDGGAAPLGTLVRGLIDTPAPGAPVKQSMAIRTTGPDLLVPAGSLLIFRLDAPATISSGAPSPSR